MLMGRGDLTNEEWARLKPHLPMSGQRGGRWASHRRIINGILYRNRTGVPWRDLPARFGKWKTVYERHRRWSADGTWDKVYAAVLADADAHGRIDWSMVSVDSTTCRAHQHAAGASKKPPRVPGKDARPDSTASMRGSDARGAASPARFTSPEKAGAAPWPC